ncbi:MAG: Calx-beta domain-containing protein [Dehalococcoidia bacterium]|nr:Calx-beta domain-containing protein [Dehalococcoidia bacterium]
MLSNPSDSYGLDTPDTTTVTILGEGDTLFRFAEDRHEFAEDTASGEVELTVERLGSLEGTASVDFATAELFGEAGGDDDYTASADTLEFGAEDPKRPSRLASPTTLRRRRTSGSRLCWTTVGRSGSRRPGYGHGHHPRRRPAEPAHRHAGPCRGAGDRRQHRHRSTGENLTGTSAASFGGPRPRTS